MNNPKMNVNTICDVSRSQPKIDPNEIVNDVFLIDTLAKLEFFGHLPCTTDLKIIYYIMQFIWIPISNKNFMDY